MGAGCCLADLPQKPLEILRVQLRGGRCYISGGRCKKLPRLTSLSSRNWSNLSCIYKPNQREEVFMQEGRFTSNVKEQNHLARTIFFKSSLVLWFNSHLILRHQRHQHDQPPQAFIQDLQWMLNWVLRVCCKASWSYLLLMLWLGFTVIGVTIGHN